MTLIPQFEDAQRVQCKASIEFEGLSGTGKSGAAMLTAKILAGEDWKSVFALDTENRSLRLLVGTPCSDGSKYGSFKVAELTPDIGYAPSNYLAIRETAVIAGAKVFVQDSISHAWQYKGGVLDKVAELKASGNARYSKDAYAAWGNEEVVNEKNKLLEMIRDERVHVISTVRVKEKMEYTTDTTTGKTKLESLGEQQIQQADLKYEPDLVLHMLKPGSNRNGKIEHPRVRVVKTRYAFLEKDEEYDWTPELINQLKSYLEEGVDPETLFEQQRQEYISGVKELIANPSKKAIAQVMKTDLGYENTKLADMPLKAIKQLYIGLTD
jgi:hypothetical protein